MDMKYYLVLLPRVTLLDKELVKWKTESENISIAFQLILPLPSHSFCPNVLILKLSLFYKAFPPVLPWVPIIDIDDGDVHSRRVILTTIRCHNPVVVIVVEVILLMVIVVEVMFDLKENLSLVS